MSVHQFFELVQIQAKTASLFSFLTGFLFVFYYFHQGNMVNTVVFFIGLLVFSMLTTMINNYVDYHQGKTDNYRNFSNVIGREKLDVHQIKKIMMMMMLVTLVTGIFLTYTSGWLVLVVGGICCFVGIFYTYGPIPLSRMPLGEVFSGLTEGFGILCILVIINVPPIYFIDVDFSEWNLNVSIDLENLLVVVLASLPMVFTISNVMLANNISDIKEDITNHRYTLPFYIGKKNALYLFDGLMLSCYTVVILNMIFKIYPLTMLVVFFVLPFIRKNTKQFNQFQNKEITFPNSVKNLVLFNGMMVVGYILQLILT